MMLRPCSDAVNLQNHYSSNVNDTSPVRIYDPLPLGTNKLKRLGEALGNREPLSEADRELYEDLIRDADARMTAMVTIVQTCIPVFENVLDRLAGAEVVGRVKTLSTLADKLERTPAEKLPAIHDVAGIRIVLKVSVLEQQVFAELMVDYFSKLIEAPRPPMIVNRIESPSHGYRALHIIVWPCGRPVEVQIRTELQHAWAQQQEILGDRWGRESRYGLDVVGESGEEIAFRESVFSQMQELSDMIAAYEQRLAATAFLHIAVDDKQLIEAANVDQTALDNVRREAEESAAELEEMHGLLAELVTVIGGRTMPDQVDAP